VARNLTGATQLDVSSHHLTCDRYQTNEKLDANSPRKKTEAGSDRKRRGAWDGRRLWTLRVWWCWVSENE
jgi:hypothetical protein